LTRKHTKTKKPFQKLPIETAVYSVDELAILLRRGRLSTYADLRAGRIPARRLGKKFLISRKRIHEWLESGGQDAA
jgi:excisionase family DNA binding protein